MSRNIHLYSLKFSIIDICDMTICDNITCECNLGNGEDVGKHNWVNPVVPVVLRHDLPSKTMRCYNNDVICDHLGMISMMSKSPSENHRSRSRTSKGLKLYMGGNFIRKLIQIKFYIETKTYFREHVRKFLLFKTFFCY